MAKKDSTPRRSQGGRPRATGGARGTKPQATKKRPTQAKTKLQKKTTRPSRPSPSKRPTDALGNARGNGSGNGSPTASPRPGVRTEARGQSHDGHPRPQRIPAQRIASARAAAAGAREQFHSESGNLPPARPRIPFTIVGIGASAGGLEAASELLGALPDDLGFCYVIVQHLDPTHESQLPTLLGRITRMPVVQVSDGLALARNSIYVIPPNARMGVADGKLQIGPRPDDHTQHNAIDYFFRSLAAYAGGSAIGIVLSGNGSDGAAGLRDIKAEAGITFAQTPKSAKFDGMPRAAIAMEAVDLALAPAEIAQELTRIARHPQPPTDGVAVPVEEADHFHRILIALRNVTGVDFTHYKQPTLRRRLQRRMVLHKVSGMAHYLRYLQQNPAEVQALYHDILIHVTRFFREPESFVSLANVVFPAIAQARSGEAPVRVWVPGCSTGEEAYSIAIALTEFLGEDGASVPVQVFATDVAETAVDRARAGVYPESIAADVSAERLRRFFNKVDGHYRISKQIRDKCVFARQDLTRDPPFSKLDLIVCRNVLIYLDASLQKRLMSIFHYALKPSGFLMLGSAETVGSHADLYQISDKRHRVYSRKMSVGMRSEVKFPPVGNPALRAENKPRPSSSETRAATTVQSEANRVLIGRYAPPGVIVNAEFEIVQFRGQTGPYLEPAPGDASLNVLKMAREGLLHALQSALREAQRKDTAVRREHVRVQSDGHARVVNVEVVPLVGASEGRHFLVLFEDSATKSAGPGRKGKPPRGVKTPVADGTRVHSLEKELAANREYLQSIIQDLEAANEELQSANEEILSANEELQSTNEELDTAKEELQSTNEELNTVNEELQARNEELSRANSDLMNLLASVQIAIVMVASDLRIRRFTPMAEKVLNLIPTDIGRPISDIKPNIECPELEKLISESIDTISIKEREVQDRNGNWMSLRIRPYKNVENRIDGAVVALIDIDATRRYGRDSESDSNALNTDLGAVQAAMQATREPMLILDKGGTVRAINRAFQEAFGETVDRTIGRRIAEIIDGRLDKPVLLQAIEKASASNGPFEIVQTPVDGKGLKVRGVTLPPLAGREPLVLLCIDVAPQDGA